MSQRILVVEDQEDNRHILRDLLTTAGFELIEATTGEEGVRLAESYRRSHPHGHSNARLDGYEATRRIKGSRSSAISRSLWLLHMR